MAKERNRKLILENGTEFIGSGFGYERDAIYEIVFNTSMVGYQEILSDPSYTDQMVVMSYPLIGNYGMTDEDYESRSPMIGGLIVREYNDQPSNFRYTKTVSEVLEENRIPGISEIDTRKLVRIIRNEGSQKAMITSASVSAEEAIEKMKKYIPPHDAVMRTSCKKKRYSRTPNPNFNVVAIDCGMKLSILRSLNAFGCNVTVVPYDTTAEEVLSLRPDGLFLSNGPGDPKDVAPVIQLVQKLRGKLPIYGICMGHQLISLAYGAKTFKMKFGHRGGNHPVKNLRTGLIEVTSQNHSYAVDADSIPDTELTITHINLLDNTVEGVACDKDMVRSVQFHPESAPGPQDSLSFFQNFINCMKGCADNA